MSDLNHPAERPEAARADESEITRLSRQNAYLKLRCAQLQDDVTNLSSQVARLQQERERIHNRGAGGSQP